MVQAQNLVGLHEWNVKIHNVNTFNAFCTYSIHIFSLNFGGQMTLQPYIL